MISCWRRPGDCRDPLAQGFSELGEGSGKDRRRCTWDRSQTVLAAVKAGAKVSVTVRQNTLVQEAIESIPAGAWTTIEYPNAIRDQASMFDVWRFYAFFTTVPTDVMNTVSADKTHGGHAIIEQVFDAPWVPRLPTCHPGSSTRTRVARPREDARLIWL